jgi:hypothetical protein
MDQVFAKGEFCELNEKPMRIPGGSAIANCVVRDHDDTPQFVTRDDFGISDHFQILTSHDRMPTLGIPFPFVGPGTHAVPLDAG